MLEDIANEFLSGSVLSHSQMFFRPLGALGLAAIIGFEREYDGRPAGLRTHMLTSLAACVYALITLALLDRAESMGDHVNTDPLRVVEAVTQGVAFLAAGLVVFSKGMVRGLTTGASMWLCAAVGLACGIGEWQLAALTTVLALIVISLIRAGEKKAGTYSKSHHDSDEEAEENSGSHR